MAPLTRVRSPEHIPGDGVAEYYRQRASDGGLIISEAAHISVMVGSYSSSRVGPVLTMSFTGWQLLWCSRHLHTRAQACLEEGYGWSSPKGWLHLRPVVARMLSSTLPKITGTDGSIDWPRCPLGQHRRTHCSRPIIQQNRR